MPGKVAHGLNMPQRKWSAIAWDCARPQRGTPSYLWGRVQGPCSGIQAESVVRLHHRIAATRETGSGQKVWARMRSARGPIWRRWWRPAAAAKRRRSTGWRTRSVGKGCGVCIPAQYL